MEENSFESPEKYVPRSETISDVASGLGYALKPWSVTILRLKERRLDGPVT